MFLLHRRGLLGLNDVSNRQKTSLKFVVGSSETQPNVGVMLGEDIALNQQDIMLERPLEKLSPCH